MKKFPEIKNRNHDEIFSLASQNKCKIILEELKKIEII